MLNLLARLPDVPGEVIVVDGSPEEDVGIAIKPEKKDAVESVF